MLHPAQGMFRLFRIQNTEAEPFHPLIGQIFDLSFNQLIAQPVDFVVGNILPPPDFMVYCCTGHVPQLFDPFWREQVRILLLHFFHHVLEEHDMGQLIPLNIFDDRGCGRHFPLPGQSVEEGESAVEVERLQQKISHARFDELPLVLMFDELLIEIGDKSVAAQQVFVVPPLVVDVFPRLWRTYSIQDIAVGLGVNFFLERLDVEQRRHFRCRDVLPDVG